MKLEKLVIGGFLSFVESGKTVDTVTVSKDAFPDDDPAENWDSLGCISEVNMEVETETDTDYCPSVTGGYDKIDDERAVRDVIKFQTKDLSEPFWRLQFGLTAEIAEGVAQMPFAQANRHIEGWLKVQAVADVDNGGDRIVAKIWGRLSIDSNPKWSKDATKPAMKFQALYSPIATLTPTSITT